MYRKISNSWFKHWDFIVLDLITLQLIFAVSIMLRNGLMTPYGEDIYLQEAVILCLADICTVFFTEEYSGIMRRGYFQEFKAALKHVLIVYSIMISYLFLIKKDKIFQGFLWLFCCFWLDWNLFRKNSLENIFAEKKKSFLR